MKSRYSSVNEQTGLFAGEGGFSINVGNHTQLNGAVIASQADPSLNQLTTGTLGFSDIDNRANYTVKTQSIGLGTGGDPGASLISNMASNMLTGAEHDKSKGSVTHAAIAPGSIIITNPTNQQQDISTLSRDTANANNALNQIFDKTKEQHRLDRVQAVGDIVSQVTDIAASEGSIQAAKARKDPNARNTAKQQLEAEGKPVTDQAISQRAYDNAMRDYGTGSALQQGISAAGAVVMGLANDDWKAAIADGASPYIAGIIHNATTDPRTHEVNKEANLTAHAIVNAALAIAKGGNALNAATQASGAVSGEAMAMIATTLYNKKPNELNESERQIVSNLATVAGGLAGGLVGGNSSSAATGAMAGKVSAANNFLGATSSDKLDESIRKIKAGDRTLKTLQDMVNLDNADARSDALLDKFQHSPSSLTSSEMTELNAYVKVYAAEMEAAYGRDTAEQLVKNLFTTPGIARTPDTEAMKIAQPILNTWGYHSSNAAIGDPVIALGTTELGSVIKGGGVALNAAIGASVNVAAQLSSSDPFSYVDAIMAGATAALTTGKGIGASAAINVGGAVIGSGIQGQDPINAAIGAGIGSVAGSVTTKGVNKYVPITKDGAKEVISSVAGSGASEYVGNKVKDNLEKAGK